MLSGCSLDPASDGKKLTIKIEDEPGQGAQLVSISEWLNGGLFSPVANPVASTDFECFALNVTGSGISSAQSFFNDCESPDNFAGVGVGKFAGFARRGESLQVQIPTGTNRRFDIYGVFPNIPECGGPSNGQGGSKGYFVGRKTQDITDETSLSIPINCNNCGSPSITNCGSKELIVDGSRGCGSSSLPLRTVPVLNTCSSGSEWAAASRSFSALSGPFNFDRIVLTQRHSS